MTSTKEFQEITRNENEMIQRQVSWNLGRVGGLPIHTFHPPIALVCPLFEDAKDRSTRYQSLTAWYCHRTPSKTKSSHSHRIEYLEARI